MKEIIKKADFLVMPSIKEGRGIVVLKAGAHAKVIITTNQDPFPEIIKQGYNEFMVNLKDPLKLTERME